MVNGAMSLPKVIDLVGFCVNSFKIIFVFGLFGLASANSILLKLRSAEFILKGET